MGDTFKLGEFEFKWEISTSNNVSSFHVFINKPRLFKFSNSFTSGELEEMTQKKHSSGELVGIIKAAFKQNNPRVTLAYSFVENIANLGEIVPLNKPESGNSLVLIVGLKSEFSEAISRFFLPLKYQKPDVEEMMSFMAQPASVDTQSADNRLQVLELSQKVAELKGTLESLHSDLAYWKSNANRISKLEENQDQTQIAKLKTDVDSHAKSIQLLQTQPRTTIPQPAAVPVNIVANYGPVIFAQVQNATLTGNAHHWQWNEVLSMPAGHFMLSSVSYTNDAITILQPGVYKVMVMATVSTSTNKYMELMKNGTVLTRVYSSSCSHYYHSFNIDNIYQCNVNDYFQVRHYYSNAPLNSKPHNYFTILKLGTTQQY